MNRTNNIRLLKISLIIIGILTVSGYGISRSLNYAQGPYIEILEPVADSTATTSLIRLRGRAERVNNVTLNGKPIQIDEQGNFSQDILVFHGLNILTMEGRDQFGRRMRLTLRITGTI